MLSCVWFVALKRAWETSVLSCIASEMCDKFDTQITIYTQGGTEGLEKLNAFSWLSLRPLEKSLIILGKSKLWHLWSYADEAPSWWFILRARTRTLHTKLTNSGKWRGHPSVMAYAMANNGETVIPPGFESIIENNVKWIPNTDELQLENGDMSDSLFGAYASLNGIKVTAPHTAIFDEILGTNGYIRKAANEAETDLNNVRIDSIALEKSEKNDRMQAEIHSSSSGTASYARRHIQENYHPVESAKKLATLYRKMLGKKG
jgi:hypothetical protein